MKTQLITEPSESIQIYDTDKGQKLGCTEHRMGDCNNVFVHPQEKRHLLVAVTVFHYLYRRVQKTDTLEGAQWQFEKPQPEVTTQTIQIKQINTINSYVGGQTLDQKPSEFECPSFEIPRTQLVPTLRKSSPAGSALIRCIALDGMQRCFVI